jgi:hypothetical protein
LVPASGFAVETRIGRRAKFEIFWGILARFRGFFGPKRAKNQAALFTDK